MNETANNSTASSSTLADRVRSLRLSDAAEPTSSGGGRLWWLPWAICGVLFCATALLALEAFSPIDDDMIKKIAEERGLNVGKGGPAPVTSLASLGVKSQAG